jgi:hypothetical protein
MERWPGPGSNDALTVAKARMAELAADADRHRLFRSVKPSRSGTVATFGRILIRIGSALADESVRVRAGSS